MKLSQNGLNKIKQFEGLRLTAYQDSVGVWTIGYGHTKNAKSGMRISESKATQLLKRDVRHFENGVNQLLKKRATQNQFDAMVSFAFNVGLGAFQRSTLLRKFNAGDTNGAANEFPRWVKAGGRTLAGLVKRRNSEKLLFLKKKSNFLKKIITTEAIMWTSLAIVATGLITLKRK